MRRIPTQFFTPVCRNPELLKSFIRGSYREFVKSKLDYRNEDGSSSALWLLSLRITHRCNHRCAICAQWGQNGYNAREDTPVSYTHLRAHETRHDLVCRLLLEK